jgi:hypothetical protein
MATMEFATPDDMACAAVFTLRYLPPLIRAFEDGVTAMGLEIVERSHFVDERTNAGPVPALRGKRLRFRLELRNAFEDLLSVDREERPPRVDPKLAVEAYARSKIADIVEGRLAIVRAIEESRNLEEAQQRVGELGDRFEWLRAVFEEDPARGDEDER